MSGMKAFCLAAVHGFAAGMRLGDADTSNPLSNLNFTKGDNHHFSKIVELVPGALLKAVEEKGKHQAKETKDVSCWEYKKGKDTPDQQEYDNIVKSGRCETVSGVNSNDMVSHASMVRFRTVAKLFKVQKRDTVLDYGAGCGHQIDEVCRHHGCTGVGVDMTPGSAEYAKKNLKHIKDYCVGTHESMRFNNETFDFIFVSGVVGHLKPEEQCTLLGKTFLNFLKPGGCAWIGGLGSKEGASEPYTWQEVPEQTFLKDDCIKHGTVKGPWVMNDQYLFGTSIYQTTNISSMDGRENSYSAFYCKPPAADESKDSKDSKGKEAKERL